MTEGHHRDMPSFDTVGPVDSRFHYCIPPLERMDLDYALNLIREKKYFVLHGPRQSGKTSAIRTLEDHLNSGAAGEYRCLYVNIEGAQTAREDVGRAMETILGRLATRARLALEDGFLSAVRPEILGGYGPDEALEEALIRWAEADPRPLVLLIDEIDALKGDSLLSVLRQLRSGYDLRPDGFPHSVVLCGVRDLRDYRIRSDSTGETVTGGSAFNISAASLRLGDFDRAEVETLLGQHTAETGQDFEPAAIDRIFTQTAGQPWLVNALCDEACFNSPQGRDHSHAITEEDIFAAQEALIGEREVRPRRLEDKLCEERVQRVIEPMLSGAPGHDISTEDCEYVRDLGLIAQGDEIRIANPIYAEVIPRELTFIVQKCLRQRAAWYVNSEGGLDGAKLVAAFQQFFREDSEPWLERSAYKEAGPQLLLQAFLQRALNGGGRLDREYGLGFQRVDILIRWPRPQGMQRFVIECKILQDGLDDTVAKGLRQTAGYMDRCGAEAGHLVIFDRSEKPCEEKIFRRTEEFDGMPVEVWGM